MAATLAVKLVEGWTDPILDQLPVAEEVTESLAGHTVECVLWDVNGNLKTGMGTSSISNAAQRIVQFTPGAGKLLKSESPYTQRWKVTRPTGEIYYHPNAAAEIWEVRKER